MDKKERQEQWKREHIKKNSHEKGTILPAVIIIAIVVAALAFCVGTFISSITKSIDKTDYILSPYTGTVTLSGNEIQTYTINGEGVYIAVNDLPSAGLKADIYDNNIDISMSDVIITDDAGRLNGKTAKRNKNSVTVNGCVMKDFSEIEKHPKKLDRYYSVDNEVLLGLNTLVSATVIASDSKDSSGNINTEIILNKTSGIVNGNTPEPRQSSGSTVINVNDTQSTATVLPKASESGKIVVFLDPGHGKDSGSMDMSEKEQSGWVKNSSGVWGEWRHWTDGEYGINCEGNDGNASQANDCWYPIENGDRDKEPDINLKNCLAAKRSLENTGKYTVVMSRNSNDENPSITKRIEMAEKANADIYVCVHSNAGGGSGSAYISMSTDSDYYAMNRSASFAQDANTLGKMINDRIVSDTSLDSYSGGCIDSEPYLILFQKTKTVCAYLEIGFFDNSSDLSILQGDSDAIGQAIANGIDDYFSEITNN